MKKYELPTWCKEAKKALIDRGMGIKDLAEALGYRREHMSAVINGRVRSPNTQECICDYLNIKST
ncbi:MAG: helix-turn-helix transcriptional regulator [Oscillospiraceae bacterium]|nr:helix-turn-helix transcriptional regulator [Oscillospiraceae bacterium]